MGGHRQKPFVVCAKHADIDIVVPGDKSAMTHCAQHRARIDEPRNLVLGAKARKHLENLELRLLQALQGVIELHVTPPYQPTSALTLSQALSLPRAMSQCAA